MRRLAGILAITMLGVAARAGEPPSAPVLRLETAMHTALIHRLAVDRGRQRIITAGEDKTVRVWRLPDLRLLATYRVPIGPANEGQLFALALSPDGKTIAVAGWTGWEWDEQGSVYLLDTETGDLVRRLAGFPNTISALAFAHDGRHLAVGLQGKQGLFVVRMADFEVVMRDAEYGDKVLEADFSRDGRLAVTALDGLIRVYDEQFELYGRKRVPVGEKPIAIRFSPDGRRLAVGFYDVARFAVVAASDMSLEYAPARVPGYANLAAVAWSADGSRLCAAGDHRGAGVNAIQCWADAGRGRRTAIAAASHRLVDLHGIGGDEFAFVAEDPALGIVGADGQHKLVRAPDLIDFAGSHGRLRATSDGSLIEFPARRGGQTKLFFSLSERNTTPEPRQVAALRPPLLAAGGLAVENWNGRKDTKINGKAIDLEPYEVSRTYAVAPDGQTLLLGTDWALRLLDRDAKQKWLAALPTQARAVNITADARIAIAALADGTIRWYRMRDGVEIMALFVLPSTKDWVCWIPSGYYMSSARGDNYIGWHVNRGKDAAPDFYLAVQFERLLYRPDQVIAYFHGRGEAPAAAPTDTRGFDIARLGELSPPRIRVEVLTVNEKEVPPRALMRVSARQSHLPLRDYTVFVNGVPVTPARERVLRGEDARGFSRQLEVELPGEDNEIRVEVFNGASMGVAERFLTTETSPPDDPPPGDLYLLAIGVNAFAKLPSKFKLSYAARDAQEIADSFRRHGAAFYRNINTKVVSDGGPALPNKRAIVNALEFIKNAGARDTVVLFLASHGASDAAGNYFFAPADADWPDVERVMQARRPRGDSLIEWTVFFDALRATAGRRLLIVDTCHARDIAGVFDAHALAKRSASSRFSLMVAAKGGENSQEYTPARHGLFTYVLLRGLAGAGDTDGDGIIGLRELFQYVAPAVETLRDRAFGPQTPQLLTPAQAGDMRLLRTRTGVAAH